MAVNVLVACAQLTYLASRLYTPSATNLHISPTIIFKLSCVDKQLMLHSKYDLICPHFYLGPLWAYNFWIKARGRDDNRNWREDWWMQRECSVAFFLVVAQDMKQKLTSSVSNLLIFGAVSLHVSIFFITSTITGLTLY